jgi:hypothetical protein
MPPRGRDIGATTAPELHRIFTLGNNCPTPELITGENNLTLSRDVEQIHRLGSARVWLELLIEFGHKHKIEAEIAAIAAKYARLDPELLRVTGADRMPPPPVDLVVGE